MARLGPDQRSGYRKIDVVEGYDRWASTYDIEPNPLIAVEEKVTLELVGDVMGQRVLDLGCGTGRYCVLLTACGAHVVGVDPSLEMLEQARRKVNAKRRFELYQGTVDAPGFPSRHFDLVISALTLGHLPELEPTFLEMARVLKGGGKMVISDIHPFWPISGHDYTEFNDETGQEYRIPVYPHLIQEYWQLCTKTGLRIEEVREPKIEDWLIERFPSLKDYRGIPLAVIIKMRKHVQ